MFQFIKYFVCALIIYFAYRGQGYYSFSFQGFFKAVRSYFREMRRLGGTVLTFSKWGIIPLGTFMCSEDNGKLPTDDVFPNEMRAIRSKFRGRNIAYFGKFGVWPWFQNTLVGMAVLRIAITEWSLPREIDLAVMIVNPKHVKRYEKFGAERIAEVGKFSGLEKAPAVLMVIDYRKSRQIKRCQREFIEKLINKFAHEQALSAT